MSRVCPSTRCNQSGYKCSRQRQNRILINDSIPVNVIICRREFPPGIAAVASVLTATAAVAARPDRVPRGAPTTA
eukprot:3038797-Pleurochrysis_carterae.AAC.1